MPDIDGIFPCVVHCWHGGNSVREVQDDGRILYTTWDECCNCGAEDMVESWGYPND